MKRSLRRHHEERLLRKMIREDYYTLSASMEEGSTAGTNTERDRLKAYRKLQDHRKHCSCWMCGNPRRQKLSRKDKLTIQERRAIEWAQHNDMR